MSKPFKRPLKNQAWRLITAGVASSYTFTNYQAIASILAELADNGTTATAFYTAINGKELGFEDIERVGTDIIALTVDGEYISKHATLVDDAGSTDILDVVDKESDILSLFTDTVPASSTVVEIIPGPNDTILKYIVRYVARPTPIILENL